jgi:peptide-methionine (S)-S-oxide reductase
MKRILLFFVLSLGLITGKALPGSAEVRMTTAKATFAAGCFWGVEEEFRNIHGVIATTVGYTGGHLQKPTYQDVCSDKTGHAEAVLVEYDPAVVSYEKILDVFWKIHDPTQLNKQGPDLGSQYRSVIYFHSPEQEKAALQAKEKLQRSGQYKSKIMTAIQPAAEFWPAEEYHQNYLQKKGRKTCHF